MADNSHIEWTDATWNPLVGCTKVSPGCDNCYAEGVVTRWHAAGKPAFPKPFEIVALRSDRFLTQPLHWAEPRRIFVNSLSDLFHADVPVEFIARVFAVMAVARQHTFQLLTKRHSRMRSLVTRPAFAQRVGELALAHGVDLFHDDPMEPGDPRMRQVEWPLPNVWLGVSVEDQHWADIRIPALLNTPAAIRWISAEPMLGPVNLKQAIGRATLGLELDDCWRCTTHVSVHGGTNHKFIRPLDWVVVGGESGPAARPMHPDWARSLRDQCEAAGVPFLFKQWGAWRHAAECADYALEEAARAAGTYDQWLRFRVYDVRLDGSAEIDRVPEHGVSAQMQRVGKTRAGRELDGRTHDGYPATVVPA